MIIKISVIIPTFNRLDFIKDAIDSVLSQSYVVDEIIVVDNNSTDGTNTLIKKNYPQIKLIQEKKQGVSNARNTGILNAKNDWIAFLDSDDLASAAEIALVYYDKTYNHGLKKRPNMNRVTVDCRNLSPFECAQHLSEFLTNYLKK